MRAGVRKVITLAAAAAGVSACSEQGAITDPSVHGVTASHAAPVYSANADHLPGMYIVVLKDDEQHQPQLPGGRARNANAVAATVGAAPHMVYEAALNGFAVHLTSQQLQLLRRHRAIDYIEEDQAVSVTGVQVVDSYGDPWGLDRIDQRLLPLTRSYTYANTGGGVYAYIVDTGLDVKHPEFGSRAANVYDAFGGTGSDCHGHGTGVGAVVGGKTFGVAKAVRLRGVRVANCNGAGTVSATIKAIDWLRQNRSNPAVANLSISSSYSTALNSAVDNLALSGVFVATAAGNNGADACNYSPASATRVVTAAASTKTDARATYSNRGKCVTAYAPGTSVRSAKLGTGAANWTGTSFASPHVAGVGALYKAKYGNAASATIKTWIGNNATSGMITGNPTGTPNRLLFKSTL